VNIFLDVGGKTRCFGAVFGFGKWRGQNRKDVSDLGLGLSVGIWTLARLEHDVEETGKKSCSPVECFQLQWFSPTWRRR